MRCPAISPPSAVDLLHAATYLHHSLAASQNSCEPKGSVPQICRGAPKPRFCASQGPAPLNLGTSEMLVDCRGLIEFCKAFEQQRNLANSPTMLETSFSHPQYKSSGKMKKGQQPLPPPLCEQSPAAAVDIIILVIVLAACGFLLTPYFRYLCIEAVHILSITLSLIGEVIYQAPVTYVAVSVLTFAAVIAGWEYYQYRTRKCDNPRCRGLRKAMEFDIQLESEQCVKSPSSEEVRWRGNVELGEDHKELEAELKRMAPPNGRAVLVFRAPCGCPAARMEVRGSKKARRLKKATG